MGVPPKILYTRQGKIKTSGTKHELAMPFTLKTFIHPHNVYRLEYPAHWDNLQQDDAKSCGFGPHDRDNVGLWISILPMSVDTDRLVEDLPKLIHQALLPSVAHNVRPDPTLRHYGLVGDSTAEDQGGHYESAGIKPAWSSGCKSRTRKE